ncbi:hypothetical protein IFVP203_C2170017 [Vibrio parahaemolyticus]
MSYLAAGNTLKMMRFEAFLRRIPMENYQCRIESAHMCN